MNTESRQNWAAFILLLTASICLGCSQGQTETETGPDHSRESKETLTSEAEKISVELEIKFNGRAADVAFAVECNADISVFEATLQACESNRVEIDYSGKEPEFRFVKALGGVVNEKSAGDNWTYRVNDKLGKVGSGVAEVEDGDRITWSFGKYVPEK